MQLLVSIRRACATFALLCAAGLAPSAAAASTPSPFWQGVTRVQILCLVRTEAGVDTGPLRDRLCGRVAALAGEAAPAPVAALAPGDPKLLAPDAVTILAHFNSERSAAGPLLAFSLRPFRASADAGSLLFSAAPRAVPLADAAALDAALHAALSETVPWQSRPAGPRPINRDPQGGM
jgi:hypothetical protein